MYFGFNDIENIAISFRGDGVEYDKADPAIINELKDADVLFAAYECEMYEGYAFVLYSKNGKLYEVNGSHCSCNGLEGQWLPEETTFEALYLRYGTDKGIESLKMSYGKEAALHMMQLLLTYEVEKSILTN